VSDETPPSFPSYQPPAGIPIADRKQAGPLQKMISKMFKPKMQRRGKALHSNQSVKINHRKVKFY